VALLSRTENPYGPAPGALAAICDAAAQGCYYADKGIERPGAMVAERFGLTPDHAVIGSGSTEGLAAAALSMNGGRRPISP
jgi:histidinol-phosphate aminotransferase